MTAKRRVLLGSLLLGVCLGGCGPQADGLYQYSTMKALLEGVYDGELTCSQLLTHGDFLKVDLTGEKAGELHKVEK